MVSRGGSKENRSRRIDTNPLSPWALMKSWKGFTNETLRSLREINSTTPSIIPQNKDEPHPLIQPILPHHPKYPDYSKERTKD